MRELSVSDNFFLLGKVGDFEREFALRYIAENSSDNADTGIGNSRMVGIGVRKQANKAIADKNECNRSKQVPE